jgi:ABC-2 type transport system ATP-binding protein
MSEAVIATRGLTRRFGKTTAVDALDLQVPRGSVFAFLGKNGAGKTTTIRMLLHLLDKTAGTAQVLGLDSVRDALAIKRRVGIVADG